MRTLVLASLSLVLWLSGCAATTHLVLLDPAVRYTPSSSVAILLRPPTRAYVEIAKLESKGLPDEPETAVLEDARERAKAVGAHAIIIRESTNYHQPPVIVDDPWPLQLPWYHDRWFGGRYGFHPPPFVYYPAERVFPGGRVYVVRSIAIRYVDEEAPVKERR